MVADHTLLLKGPGLTQCTSLEIHNRSNLGGGALQLGLEEVLYFAGGYNQIYFFCYFNR